MTINNPLTETDDPMGEYPDVPPRSGVARYLDAADRVRDHATNLQAAIDEIRQVTTNWYDGSGLKQMSAAHAGASILGILERHGV